MVFLNKLFHVHETSLHKFIIIHVEHKNREFLSLSSDLTSYRQEMIANLLPFYIDDP